MDAIRSCPICGDVIGVYEPLVAIARGVSRTTSLASEPELGAGAQVILHLKCADGAGLLGDRMPE